ILGHRAGEAGLLVLHHRGAMVEVFSADRLRNVIAVGVDRLLDLSVFLVAERPGGLVDLERGVLRGLRVERRRTGAKCERGGHADYGTHWLSPRWGDSSNSFDA